MSCFIPNKFGQTGFILVLFLVCSSNIFAQSDDSADVIIMPAPDSEHICTLDPVYEDAGFFVLPDRTRLLSEYEPAAEFQITYAGECSDGSWPVQTQQAFDYAAEIMSYYISSDIPIRIMAYWRPLGGNTLGSAGPTQVVQVAAVQPNTYYAIAQASAMTGIDYVGNSASTQHDMVVNMNCDYPNWYFGTDGNTPPNRIDFVTVLLHEMAHGLGFLGSMNASNQSASYGFGSNNYPITYDREMRDGNDESLMNQSIFPNPSFRLYQALTGQRNGIFYHGQSTLLVNNHQPARIFTPSNWQPGSSYSHVDLQTYTNTENALMRPSINTNLAIHSPGPIFCGMFADMGWPMGPKCLDMLETDANITVSINEDIDFGVSNIGIEPGRPFTVSNAPFAQGNLEVSFVLDDTENYSVNGGVSLDLVLEPGQEETVQIRYRPQTADAHKTQLTVFHNADNMPSPVTLELSGVALERDAIASLEQNYPNPFNSSTTITYTIATSSNVNITLYTVDGRKVKTIVDGFQPEGRYAHQLNASDMASGLYLYRMVYRDFTEIKKLLLVR